MSVSSRFLDALHAKVARGESLTLQEQGEIVEAYASLLTTYHATEPLREGGITALVDGLSDEQVCTFMLELCDLIAERVGDPPIIGFTPDEVREALRRALGARSVSGERGEPT